MSWVQNQLDGWRDFIDINSHNGMLMLSITMNSKINIQNNENVMSHLVIMEILFAYEMKLR